MVEMRERDGIGAAARLQQFRPGQGERDAVGPAGNRHHGGAGGGPQFREGSRQPRGQIGGRGRRHAYAKSSGRIFA
jgi:hypothetical protein